MDLEDLLDIHIIVLLMNEALDLLGKISTYGSQSDGGVLWYSGFGQRLLSGILDLPEDSYLPGTCTKFPYFMVGDAAFRLISCITRAYPASYTYLNSWLTAVIIFLFFLQLGMLLSPDRETFNRRLSRARD